MGYVVHLLGWKWLQNEREAHTWKPPWLTASAGKEQTPISHTWWLHFQAAADHSHLLSPPLCFVEGEIHRATWLVNFTGFPARGRLSYAWLGQHCSHYVCALCTFMQLCFPHFGLSDSKPLHGEMKKKSWAILCWIQVYIYLEISEWKVWKG